MSRRFRSKTHRSYLRLLPTRVVWPMITEITSIAYGVVSMTGWGGGDFLIKRAVGSVGYYKLMLYTQLVGLVPIFILGTAFLRPPSLSPATIPLIISTGVLSFGVMFFFFKGMSVGKASIITPIAQSSSIFAIAVAYTVLGETLDVSQLLCVAVVVVGILIVSIRPGSNGHSNAGISYALACMISMGLNSLLIKLLSRDIGGMGTLFSTRVMVVLLLMLTFPYPNNPGSRESQSKIPYATVVLAGLGEFLGAYGYVVGIGAGMVSIVVPISSASPAVTVLLARLFLKERLVRIHIIGVVLVMLGILLLSFISVSQPISARPLSV